MLISIYITNFNYGNYLEKAIKSAINQTYKSIEIIIIDDASKDISKKILNKYKKNKKIKIIYNKKKNGLVKSSNKAIKASKGKYVLRLDADDFLHPNAIKEMYSQIKNCSDTALVFPNFYELENKSKRKKIYKYQHKQFYGFGDQPAHGACSLINKRIFYKIGGYNNKFDRQDGYYIWFAILSNNYNIKHCKKPLFYYRKHGKNLSKNSKKILQTRLNILRYFSKTKLDFDQIFSIQKNKTFLKLKKLKNF